MKKIHNFLFGTLRGRLILSVSAVHAVLMMLFIIDLTHRQRDMLMERQEDDAIALSHALSTTASGWLASKDISGLQELVEAQRRYPELVFAILTDAEGHILAHTDSSKVGKFLLDLPRDARQTVINKTPEIVDVAVPALLADKHVGWVRIGLGQKVALKKLNAITLNGTFYAFLAILIGSFIAWLMGSQITRRLYAIQHTISEVSAGNPAARSRITGTDEAAQLAREFNAMLDTLSEREEKISKSEARFAKLFNLAAVPLCLINKDGVLVDYNKRFEQIFGYNHQDIPTIKEWWQLAYPDPDYRKLMVSGWEAEVKTASEQKRDIIPSECKVTCKNGKVRTFMASGTTINDDLLATFYDITNRKRAEEALRMSEKRLRTIIETEPECVKIIDQKGDLLDINPSGLAMLESNSVEEVKSHTLLEFILPEYRTAFQELHKRVMQGENGLLEFEVIGLRGTRRWLETHAAPMRDEKGEVTMLLGITRDVTNRKLSEQELIKAKEHAEESDRLKSAFLANMSHEIRTPMNGILGFAELLKEPGLSGKDQQEYIKIIEKSGVRMLNIINDIVDISKIESNQMKVSLSETSINEKTEYIFNFFKPEATNKGIQLVFKNGLSANESLINTDSEKVYAILTNLVKNAIKFTDHGLIEFGYSLKTDNKPSELEFFVKDTGIGIPKDKQEAIFDRFVQADISDKRAFQGAGLGLSISKAYVEMLGGKIWVESKEGKGSSFYFTIPYNAVPKTDIVLNTITSEEEVKNQIKSLKILIVEDDKISNLFLSKAIKAFSKEVLKATTGVEAVEICRNNPDIDLVMMDVNMPIMNGYEATRQIRQFNNDVIIIAQTAYGMSSDREEAIAAGCNNYISKPINISLLNGLIQKYF